MTGEIQMKNLYIVAGFRIKELRKARGYTREELAEMASISAKFLYEIENGKKGFSTEILYHIAQALDVKCDYILSGDSLDCYEKEAVKMLEMFNDFEIDKIKKLLEIIYELK